MENWGLCKDLRVYQMAICYLVFFVGGKLRRSRGHACGWRFARYEQIQPEPLGLLTPCALTLGGGVPSHSCGGTPAPRRVRGQGAEPLKSSG